MNDVTSHINQADRTTQESDDPNMKELSVLIRGVWHLTSIPSEAYMSARYPFARCRKSQRGAISI